MRLENGKVVLERKNCWCGDGTKPAGVPCPGCEGTGNGKRGGKGQCKNCFGLGKVYNSGKRVVCDICKGQYENAEPETFCDTIPLSIYTTIPVVVYRTGQPMNFLESLIGMGCLYSCTDYGRAWNDKTDEKLIQEVKIQQHTQATKVCKEDGTFCNHIGIFVRRTGYTVQAVFGEAK